MALTPCRECKKDVSTEAAACPHCGVKRPVKGSDSKLFIVAIGTVLLVTLCTAVVSGGRDDTDGDQAATAQVAPAQAASTEVSQAPIEEPSRPVLMFTDGEKKILRLLLIDDFTVYANGGESIAGEMDELAQGQVVVTADELQRAYDANEVSADQSYRGKGILLRGKVESINRSIGDSHYLTLHGGTNMFMRPNARMADGHVNYLASLRKGQQVSLACTGKGMLAGSAWLSDCAPLDSWIAGAVERTIAKLPAMVASEHQDTARLAVIALALAAVVPSDSACWKNDTCKKQFAGLQAKVAQVPGLLAQIAGRLGLPEADVNGMLAKKKK